MAEISKLKKVEVVVRRKEGGVTRRNRKPSVFFHIVFGSKKIG